MDSKAAFARNSVSTANVFGTHFARISNQQFACAEGCTSCRSRKYLETGRVEPFEEEGEHEEKPTDLPLRSGRDGQALPEGLHCRPQEVRADDLGCSHQGQGRDGLYAGLPPVTKLDDV